MNSTASERRDHARFSVMRNVGEPIVVNILHEGKPLSVPGFIMNLSAGGVGIITLGDKPAEFSVGSHFSIELKLPHLVGHNVEGLVYRIEKAQHAAMHHTSNEWYLGLRFTKIKPSLAEHINTMAEEWSICETKTQMHLPDICYRQCSFWDLCEKSVKLKQP